MMSKDKNKSAGKKNGNGKNVMQDRRDASRVILPIPDIPPVTLTTFDAKDPDTKYPPISPLRWRRFGEERDGGALRRR